MSISHLHVELVPKIPFGVNLEIYSWGFWFCSLQEDLPHPIPGEELKYNILLILEMFWGMMNLS